MQFEPLLFIGFSLFSKHVKWKGRQSRDFWNFELLELSIHFYLHLRSQNSKISSVSSKTFNLSKQWNPRKMKLLWFRVSTMKGMPKGLEEEMMGEISRLRRRGHSSQRDFWSCWVDTIPWKVQLLALWSLGLVLGNYTSRRSQYQRHH